MIRSSFARFAVLGALLVALLTGCREAETPTLAPAPTDTPRPVPSEMPTETPTEAPTATETSTPTATATLIPLASGPVDFPPNVNPLTGLFVSDVELLERNPVMVKISNFPRSLRPHFGLSWADIVIEHYIGTGATRFSAIYYGQTPPEAGPVRSARMIDAQLGNAYNSIFAFASADATVFNRVITALDNRAISEGPGTCPALCRTGTGDVNSVRAYPDLLTVFALEERDVPAVRPNLNGMRFDQVAPEASSLAGNKVTVQYSTSTISEWQFDAASEMYMRFIEEVDINGNVSIAPLTDRLTELQLTAANVIVLFVETIELKPTLHDFNLLNNLSGRRALLFRDGQVYDLIWRAQGPMNPVQFFTLEGEIMPLRPGNTWIHVVGLSSNVEETAAGEYEVLNFIP